MLIKLIATDMDGTLLMEDKSVSELNARALRSCEARGIMAVMASGRSFESIGALARSLGLTSPIVSTNGARVDASPDGPTLMMDVFARDVAERVYRLLMEDGAFFVCYAPGRLYLVNPDGYGGAEMSQARAMREFDDWTQIEVVHGPEATFADALGETMKFIVYSRDPVRLKNLERQLDAMGLYLSTSDDESLEIMVPGSGKGRALVFLMEHYAIKREETMAFGDYINDLTMLESVGYPVAMGNAIDEVKRVAWTVAPTNEQSGVGRTIMKYVLEEEA